MNEALQGPMSLEVGGYSQRIHSTRLPSAQERAWDHPDAGHIVEHGAELGIVVVEEEWARDRRAPMAKLQSALGGRWERLATCFYAMYPLLFSFRRCGAASQAVCRTQWPLRESLVNLAESDHRAPRSPPTIPTSAPRTSVTTFPSTARLPCIEGAK